MTVRPPSYFASPFPRARESGYCPLHAQRGATILVIAFDAAEYFKAVTLVKSDRGGVVLSHFQTQHRATHASRRVHRIIKQGRSQTCAAPLRIDRDRIQPRNRAALAHQNQGVTGHDALPFHHPQSRPRRTQVMAKLPRR